MAIQAIPDSRTAYQGSVPGTEGTVRVSERSTGGSFSESVAKQVTTEVPASRTQNFGNGADERANEAFVGTEAVKKAVEEFNRKATNSEAVFGVHDQTNRITIKIVDKETKEVIKEFPPEEMLDMIAKGWEIAGIVVDEKR